MDQTNPGSGRTEMTSDRPGSHEGQAQNPSALEECCTAYAQVEQPVGECICPQRASGIRAYAHILCPIHSPPSDYHPGMRVIDVISDRISSHLIETE